jgi:hypothetical protein
VFLRDRLIRLGIPLFVFSALLRPALSLHVYSLAKAQAAAEGSVLPFWWFYWESWNPGPLWFVEVLLVFCALYALVRWLHAGRAARPAITRARLRPSTCMVAMFGLSLALALVTCVWRIAVPLGQYWPIVGLPTPAYLPQYATCFVIGVVAYRRGWAQAAPVRAGWFGLAQALIVPIVVGAIGILAEKTFGRSVRMWLAVYATAESFLAVGLIVALIVFFRAKLNRQGPLARVMSAHCYTVYIIHPLVLVGLGYAFRWLHAIALLKFALLAVVGVPLCWVCAIAVRALPYAKRVV